MVLPLKSGDKSLSDIEGKLSVKHLENIEEEFDMSVQQLDDIWLPKYEMEETLNLKETLIKLGMSDIFDDRANFSGCNGDRNLFVDQVLHKAHLVVDEEGTRAAAATLVRVYYGVSSKPDFIANKPFLFFLRENKSKIVLFMGRYCNPKN